MRRIIGWLGLAGIGLVLVGGLASLVTRQLTSWRGGLLFAGLVLVLMYAVGNYRELRRILGGEKGKRGVITGASIVLVLAILTLVVIIASHHRGQVDLTEARLFSLYPQTVRVLEGLTEEVSALCFYKETTPGRQALEELLERCRHRSRHFSYRFLDPDRNPGEAQNHQVTSYGTTVLVSGEKEERIYGHEERDVTNALIKVTREGRKVFYFLTGHGEHEIDDSERSGLSYLGEALEQENFDVKELLLLRTEAVPADCAVLAVVGPSADLMEPEIKSIRDYLEGGGKALFLVDPDEKPLLEDLLRDWGIELGNDMIVDPVSRLLAGDARMPIVNQYEKHDITRDFGLASFFPLARSVDVADSLTPGTEGQRLALTGDDAWGETDLERMRGGRAGFDEGEDLQGPVPVGAVVTRVVEGAEEGVSGEEEVREVEGEEPGEEGEETSPRRTRLVVFGDSDFVTNAHVGSSGNGNLILNSLSWLAAEEDLVAIRPRSSGEEPLILSATQGRLVFWLPMVGMPVGVITAGLLVLGRRRRRR